MDSHAIVEESPSMPVASLSDHARSMGGFGSEFCTCPADFGGAQELGQNLEVLMAGLPTVPVHAYVLANTWTHIGGMLVIQPQHDGMAANNGTPLA